MIRPRRLALLAALLPAALAGPAHATLLVRSDGAGLLIRDKNGLSDDVRVTDIPTNSSAYTIHNANLGDVFAFDAQFGCSTFASREATCARNGSTMTIELLNGNDQLAMAPSTPVGNANISVGAGKDFVVGHPGKDEISGSTGEDRLLGQGGDDLLRGGDQTDDLDGGDGADRLEGAAGNDLLRGGRGVDLLLAGSDSDFVDSKEPTGTTAVADEVFCNEGFDSVRADLKDSVASTCEEIERSPVGETPHVSILGKSLRVASSGHVRVRLRCPRGVRSLGCNGRLQLRVGQGAGSSRSRRVRYRIKAGRRKAVTLKLSARDVRNLRGKRRRGVLTSVEKGRKGPKTTIRNPRLRLR